MNRKKTSAPLNIDGKHYGNGAFWMHYEYEDKEYPLLFIELPNLHNRHVIQLLKAFDELYGDTNQETNVWALEFQLLTRLLVTEGQLLVNPLHLDLSEEGVIQTVLDAIPEMDRSAYMSVRTIGQDKIRRAFEEFSSEM